MRTITLLCPAMSAVEVPNIKTVIAATNNILRSFIIKSLASASPDVWFKIGDAGPSFQGQRQSLRLIRSNNANFDGYTGVASMEFLCWRLKVHICRASTDLSNPSVRRSRMRVSTKCGFWGLWDVHRIRTFANVAESLAFWTMPQLIQTSRPL